MVETQTPSTTVLVDTVTSSPQSGALEPETKTPSSQTATLIAPIETNESEPTETSIPADDVAADASTPIATPTPSLDPENWQEWPVIPDIGPTAMEIFRKGIVLGNNPGAFSKIGDCGSTPAWFLGDFDRGEKFYSLGQYTELTDVINQFQGSYGRTSLAAKSGFNASSVFASIWSNREYCDVNEAPIECEYRLHKPSYALIMLGSNDVYHLDTFELQMRKIIEFLMEVGVVPILSTKADNLEGDFSVNQTLARLSLEYGIPLVNYWAAVQPLPSQGLQEDGVHITWARNFFDDPEAMKSGWTIRNLTALQILDAVWRSVTQNK